jgi:hypothetical protein
MSEATMEKRAIGEVLKHPLAGAFVTTLRHCSIVQRATESKNAELAPASQASVDRGAFRA